jgi:hypothetical protein
MKIIKILAIVLASMLVNQSVLAGQVESDVRCFIDDVDQKIKLEMRTYVDGANGWAGGAVRYGKDKDAIPLVWLSSKVIGKFEGRFSTFETVWLEVAAGEVSGRYTTTTQGANVYGFEYTAHQSNKTYKFSETVERNASADGCKW